ncbi:MAG: hypothetical protein ABEJ43_09530 [Haloferacaceae archaeon]
MVGYYDYVLLLIPLAMLSIVGLLTAVGWPLVSAAPVGAGVSTLVIGHALFLRAPDDDPDDTVMDASAVDSVAPASD